MDDQETFSSCGTGVRVGDGAGDSIGDGGGGRPRGEHVDRPVPAVGGLQAHLRIRPRLRDLQRQRDRIILDPHRVQPLPGRRHPHDHRPAPMQINPHELPFRIPFHQGPPSS